MKPQKEPDKVKVIAAVVSNKFIEIANPCTIPIPMMEHMIKQSRKIKDNDVGFAMYIELPGIEKYLKEVKKKSKKELITFKRKRDSKEQKLPKGAY